MPLPKLDDDQIRTLELQLEEVRRPYKYLEIFSEKEEREHLQALIIAEQVAIYRDNALKNKEKLDFGLVFGYDLRPPTFKLDYLTDEQVIAVAEYSIDEHNKAVNGNLVLQGIVYATFWCTYGVFFYDIVLVAGDVTNGTQESYEVRVRIRTGGKKTLLCFRVKKNRDDDDDDDDDDDED